MFEDAVQLDRLAIWAERNLSLLAGYVIPALGSEAAPRRSTVHMQISMFLVAAIRLLTIGLEF